MPSDPIQDRESDSADTESPDAESQRPTLVDRLPDTPLTDSDEILDRFLDWVAQSGFELYAAQEEAILEIMADRDEYPAGAPAGDAGASGWNVSQGCRLTARGPAAMLRPDLGSAVRRLSAICD